MVVVDVVVVDIVVVVVVVVEVGVVVVGASVVVVVENSVVVKTMFSTVVLAGVIVVTVSVASVVSRATTTDCVVVSAEVVNSVVVVVVSVTSIVTVVLAGMIVVVSVGISKLSIVVVSGVVVVVVVVVVVSDISIAFNRGNWKIVLVTAPVVVVFSKLEFVTKVTLVVVSAKGLTEVVTTVWLSTWRALKMAVVLGKILNVAFSNRVSFPVLDINEPTWPAAVLFSNWESNKGRLPFLHLLRIKNFKNLMIMFNQYLFLMNLCSEEVAKRQVWIKNFLAGLAWFSYFIFELIVIKNEIKNFLKI